MMMQRLTYLTALAAALAGLAAAHPSPFADDSALPELLVARKNQNGTDSNSTTIASEALPQLSNATCVCAEPICDTRLNSKSICQCQANAKVACFKASNGACPEPPAATCT